MEGSLAGSFMLVVWIFLTADNALLGAEDTVLCKKINKQVFMINNIISGFYTSIDKGRGEGLEMVVYSPQYYRDSPRTESKPGVRLILFIGF